MSDDKWRRPGSNRGPSLAVGCRKRPTLYWLDCADVAAHMKALFAKGGPPFQTQSGAAGLRTGGILWPTAAESSRCHTAWTQPTSQRT